MEETANKVCQQCGKPLNNERCICTECRKANKREYAKQRYKVLKEQCKIKRYGETICSICGKPLIKNRPNQTYHGYCKKVHKTVDDYNKVGRSVKGNTIGRQIIIDLGFKNLNKDIVVHHIDENPENNNTSNLLILSRSNHAKLHRYLERNWSLLSKDNSSNLENCWKTLRDQLTTTWLETMSVNVRKIVDIGQSAAEPLNSEYIYLFRTEEGSETMH